MDFFTEHIIKQKKSNLKLLAAIGMIVVTLAVWILTLPFTTIPVASSFVMLVDAAVAYCAYLVITSFNIEYEYCITNSEMDVDKIINRKKRKRIASLKFTNIEIMAPVGDIRFENEENGEFASVIMAAIAPRHPDAYYIIFDNNGKRTKLIFNPSKKMIETAIAFAPKKVYER